jgi:methionyl aminopeptidase
MALTAAPRPRCSPTDRQLARESETMARIPLKTRSEIEAMREANRIARHVVAGVGQHVAPGVTTLQLEEVARQLTHEAGVKPAFYQHTNGGSPFPAYLCTSVNEGVVHGIPNDTPLREGDIVGIDYGCILDGWYGDTAYTYPVGAVAAETEHLLSMTREALAVGIAAAQPGRRVYDVSKAIERFCESNGLSVIRALCGHGIGRALWEPPQVPNYVQPESRADRLRPGTTICIEPMTALGGWEVDELDDGWTVVTADRSLAAQFEHCIAITEDGPDILSLPDEL